MYIDIDLAPRHFQEGDEEGKASCRHGIAVGDAHDARQRSVLHRSSVDEEELLGRAIAVMGGKGTEGLQTHALLLRDDGEGVFQEEVAHHLRDAFFGGVEREGLVACGQEEFSFLVVEAFELHIGIGKRDAFYLCEYESVFVRVAAEESQSCGGCEEEVLHLDVGALGVDAGFGIGDLSCFDEDFGGVSCFRAAFDERSADRRDCSQGFAAKAEGVDVQKIVFGQLRGCVSFDGESQAFFIHAATVVLNAQQRLAAVSDGDAHAGGLSVERVFDKLLDGGGGSFQHLTSSDAIDDFLRKTSDDGLRSAVDSEVGRGFTQRVFGGRLCSDGRALLCCRLRHGFGLVRLVVRKKERSCQSRTTLATTAAETRRQKTDLAVGAKRSVFACRASGGGRSFLPKTIGETRSSFL